MSRIQIIRPEQAEGELNEIYSEILDKRGGIAEVYQIQSLNPKSIKTHLDLYMTIMFGKSPLKRVTREIIGTVVSVANGCKYCATHHGEAVNHYWKDDQRMNALIEDYSNANLSLKDLALANYAHQLTVNPASSMENDHTIALKDVGLDDKEILDATLIVGYFNFVNRMVLSLGVTLEESGGKGYKME